MNTDYLWWGYLHTNGSIQAKRYWGRWQGSLDIQDAHESPFVARVCNPFSAEGRDEALVYLKKHFSS